MMMTAKLREGLLVLRILGWPPLVEPSLVTLGHAAVVTSVCFNSPQFTTVDRMRPFLEMEQFFKLHREDFNSKMVIALWRADCEEQRTLPFTSATSVRSPSCPQHEEIAINILFVIWLFSTGSSQPEAVLPTNRSSLEAGDLLSLFISLSAAFTGTASHQVPPGWKTETKAPRVLLQAERKRVIFVETVKSLFSNRLSLLSASSPFFSWRKNFSNSFDSGFSVGLLENRNGGNFRKWPQKKLNQHLHV